MLSHRTAATRSGIAGADKAALCVELRPTASMAGHQGHAMRDGAMSGVLRPIAVALVVAGLLSAVGAMRRSRHHTQKTPDHGRINHGRIKHTVSIRERPAEPEDRAVPGHWEGDLFFGRHNSQIATLVERQTRYLMLVKVSCKDTETEIDALIKQAHKLPRELYKSLTWDRGPEMADHQRFSLATDVKVYFCDPQQPWQRESNENTNGLLRQYFPKGMDLSDIQAFEATGSVKAHAPY